MKAILRTFWNIAEELAAAGVSEAELITPETIKIVNRARRVEAQKANGFIGKETAIDTINIAAFDELDPGLGFVSMRDYMEATTYAGQKEITIYLIPCK